MLFIINKCKPERQVIIGQLHPIKIIRWDAHPQTQTLPLPFLKVCSCLTIVLHIEPKAVNEYIDQLPLLVLQKLKQKFDMHCDHNFELPQDQFALIYAGSARGDEPVSNSTQAQKVQQLYRYYSDLGQSRLNLKKFITKYATLWKSEPGRLGNIIYFILSTAKDEEGQ